MESKEELLRRIEEAKKLEKQRAELEKSGSSFGKSYMIAGMPWGCWLWALGALGAFGYLVWKFFSRAGVG